MKLTIALLLCFSGALRASDEAFLKDAAGDGILDVKLGELAQINGTAQFVKDFGQRMVTDHASMNQAVQDVAGKQNITLPSDITLNEKGTYEALAKKKGAEFDKAYIAYMVADHEQELAAFQREVDSGTDADSKDLATRTIPIIKEHLRLARQTADQLSKLP